MYNHCSLLSQKGNAYFIPFPVVRAYSREFNSGPGVSESDLQSRHGRAVAKTDSGSVSMVCLCKRILLVFLFTVVGFSASPSMSYAYTGCKYQAPTHGHPAVCVTGAPKGKCYPTDTGTGTGKCIMLSGDNSCECRGSELPPPVCKNATGAIFPKYYILGLVYAPPGCTSTSALKCSTQSSVDYQASSSMGTKVSMENAFSKTFDDKVDVSVGVKDAGSIGASVSGGYQNTSSDSKSQTITKGQSLDIKATGNGDGIDHDQDLFILLLNPAVAVRENTQVVNNQCGPTVVSWYMGVSGSSGHEALYTIPVGWLKNPSSMPANVVYQLQTLLKFTNDDYQTILAQDPFANGSTTIDSNRFTLTTYSFPYIPTQQLSDCNNGVCSCTTFADTLKNEFQTDVGSKYQDQYSLGFSESAGFDIGVLSIKNQSDQKFTWTSTSTNDATTDSSQSALAAVMCPSSNYQGPTNMDVYWDKLFGSFMFVPTWITQPQIISQGTAADASGKPVRHEAVTLSFGGKTYHTWTNNRGDYVFSTPASLPTLNLPTSGQLSIRTVRQVVTLPSAQKLQILVPTTGPIPKPPMKKPPMVVPFPGPIQSPPAPQGVVQ